jgi:hypothetical protein
MLTSRLEQATCRDAGGGARRDTETQSGLFCTIETMCARRWRACLMLGSSPQHASFLYTLVSTIRASPGPTLLRPGGVENKNWMTVFANREFDDDENQWIDLSVLGLR